jgi:hypothetical protein
LRLHLQINYLKEHQLSVHTGNAKVKLQQFDNTWHDQLHRGFSHRQPQS